MQTDNRLNRLLCRPNLGRVTHVIRVGAQDNYSMACCSLQPEWFLGHWNGSKTVRCTGDHDTCPGHVKQWPERPKGYITVCSLRDLAPMLLELTPGAGEMLEEAFPFSESMRGHVLFITRLRKSLKSPLCITRCEPVKPAIKLPEPINPEPTLLRLWPLVAN